MYRVKESVQNNNLDPTKIKIDTTNILPEEVILEIFSYLEVDDLGRCECVSRKYKRLSNDPNLIRDVISNSMQKLKAKGLCVIGAED